MHRFYLPPEQCQAGRVCLTEGEAHHALHVLRVREGDPVQVLDGAGQVLDGRVLQVARDRVFVDVVSRHNVPTPMHRITLLQALPRGQLIESIIQKAVELGAARIVPLLSERVIARLDHEQTQAKQTRWQQVAIEALKQCGSPWLPAVEPAVTPHSFLGRREPVELALLGSLQRNATHPRTRLKAFEAQHGRYPHTIQVWIGPEGDFTAEEITEIEAGGAFPITMGSLVLRTETAALYALSILHYELNSPIG
jgi:16S rRNA (uracil1498-N3)-methyltransferase